MDPVDWFWGEEDGDDDESVPPHFNEPDWGVGMEGEDDDD